jgi:uncharacterized protein YqeY
MSTLFDQVSSDIRSAMKARDKVRLEALRNIKKYFIEAKTAPGANDTLEDDAAMKILQKLAKQGEESADTYTKAGRQELADAELAQVAVIKEYLPQPLTEEGNEAQVKDIIAQTGATDMKAMGQVMGLATNRWPARPTARLSLPSSASSWPKSRHEDWQPDLTPLSTQRPDSPANHQDGRASLGVFCKTHKQKCYTDAPRASVAIS